MRLSQGNDLQTAYRNGTLYACKPHSASILLDVGLPSTKHCSGIIPSHSCAKVPHWSPRTVMPEKGSLRLSPDQNGIARLIAIGLGHEAMLRVPEL